MAKKIMTGRDRFRAMLHRRPHDRVPRYDAYWSETIQRWEAEGLRGGYRSALEALDYDIEGVGDSIPDVYRGTREVLAQDEQTVTYRDPWGAVVRFWKNRSGTPEHLAFECDGRDAWETKIKPRMLALGPQQEIAYWKARYREHREAGRYTNFAAQETFELTRKLMGDVGSLMAMAEDPDLIRDISSTVCDLALRDFNHLIGQGIEPDGVWIYGDMAYNHGTMCSPQMYKELVWPEHKRLADWAHAHGMEVLFHTDGDIRAVLDLLIDAGIDCIQPLEAKAGMDVRDLAPRYATRLAMFGNIDVTVLASNDPARIEEEVASKLRAGMAAKAYAYHSDHSIPPTVSWATYRLLIQLLDRYGRYD